MMKTIMHKKNNLHCTQWHNLRYDVQLCAFYALYMMWISFQKCICVSGSYSQQWPDDKEILLELVYKHFTFYGVDCKG